MEELADTHIYSFDETIWINLAQSFTSYYSFEIVTVNTYVIIECDVISSIYII
jgi:hypothetical protein